VRGAAERRDPGFPGCRPACHLRTREAVAGLWDACPTGADGKLSCAGTVDALHLARGSQPLHFTSSDGYPQET